MWHGDPGTTDDSNATQDHTQKLMPDKKDVHGR